MPDAKGSIEINLLGRTGVRSAQSIIEEELERCTYVRDEIPVVLAVQEGFEGISVWTVSTHRAVVS